MSYRATILADSPRFFYECEVAPPAVGVFQQYLAPNRGLDADNVMIGAQATNGPFFSRVADGAILEPDSGNYGYQAVAADTTAIWLTGVSRTMECWIKLDSMYGNGHMMWASSTWDTSTQWPLDASSPLLPGRSRYASTPSIPVALGLTADAVDLYTRNRPDRDSALVEVLARKTGLTTTPTDRTILELNATLTGARGDRAKRTLEAQLRRGILALNEEASGMVAYHRTRIDDS